MSHDLINENRPNWTALLANALNVPGRLSEAYSVFHSYSIGNQFLAAMQLLDQNLPLSPIASFMRWKELGRNVKKGSKAIALVMPVTVKKKDKDPVIENNTSDTFTFFSCKRNWFSLDQTEGAEYAHEVKSHEWEKDKALASLKIEMVAFEHLDGNCQGYAVSRKVAVSPIAAFPHKTLFHELAHVVLGHTNADAVMADSSTLSKCIKEAEAEATAFLCCATLELPGMDESRGYIQSWLNGQGFPDQSARRVFTAADKILKAGSPA